MIPTTIATYAPGISGFLLVLFMGLMTNLLIVIPFWFIFKKAGFPAALSLIMLIPLGNIIMPFVLAFTEWPALKDKKAASANSAATW